MFVERVTEHTYANLTEASRCNIGAITLPDYTIVVDTGQYPHITKKFRTIIEKKTGTPVKKVLITHGHADHVFGNQMFKDCDIIANQAVMEQMKKFNETEWTKAGLEEAARHRPDQYAPMDFDRFEVIFPSEVVDSEFTLSVDDFKIVYKQVGGHTYDSSYIYLATERVMFVGDLLFTTEFPWGGSPTSNLDTWIQTFKEFQQLGVEKIIPGHGAVCGQEKVQTYLDFFKTVAKIMKEMITEGCSQAEVVSYKGFPDFYPPRPGWRIDALKQWYQAFKSKME